MKYARSLDGLRNFVSDDRISENATVAYEGWKRITQDVTVRGIQFQLRKQTQMFIHKWINKLPNYHAILDILIKNTISKERYPMPTYLQDLQYKGLPVDLQRLVSSAWFASDSRSSATLRRNITPERSTQCGMHLYPVCP